MSLKHTLNLIVLSFVLLVQGCSITGAAGENLDFTETRKIVVEPHRIEISGDIDMRDWKHLYPIHQMVK